MPNTEHRPCQLVKTNKYLIKSKGYVKFRAAPKQQGHDGEQAKYKYFVQRDHELFDGLNKHYKNQRVTENPAQMVFLYRSQRRVLFMLQLEKWSFERPRIASIAPAKIFKLIGKKPRQTSKGQLPVKKCNSGQPPGKPYVKGTGRNEIIDRSK